jgi:transcriptional regulator GlxA family with amidase domain
MVSIARSDHDSLWVLRDWCGPLLSPRPLQWLLGLPPISILRRKRLGDMHAALLMGGHATTVREIAIEHGFVELDRFAAAYRRLFGELPSRTLQRRIRP